MGKRMIGILTFYWADDYGAMLQAYALKYYLEKVSNKKVKIIPYAPVKFTGRYWLYPVVASQQNGKLRYRFVSYRFKRNLSIFSKFLKRRKKMRTFRKSYLSRGLIIRRPEWISLKKYSCVFVGSDQVWNPEITIGLDDAYMGNVKHKDQCKLVAYGASFGGSEIEAKFISEFEKFINGNFKTISSREKSAAVFLENILHRTVEEVLDPTLLLNQYEWQELGKQPREEDYILFVFTEYNEQMVQYLHSISMELQKKVIQLSLPWLDEKEEWIDIKIECGPSEFIGYFQNATYVVTNSFHGMVFSVLFEKQFLVFSHSNKNVRIENFLNKLCLKTRLIQCDSLATKENMTNKIDWKYVKGMLEKEKEFSARFIQENCEDI